MPRLRTLAENDLGGILEDSSQGFGIPITVTDPAGLVKQMIGFSNDIARIIDPETGQIVKGRIVTVALRQTSVIAVGFTSQPIGIAKENKKPWLIEFNDLHSVAQKFKVVETFPDNALGIIVCELEQWND